jgi:hypothetical protein
MGLFFTVMDPYPDLQKFSIHYLDIFLLSLLVHLYSCFAATMDAQEYLGPIKLGRVSSFEELPMEFQPTAALQRLRGGAASSESLQQ